MDEESSKENILTNNELNELSGALGYGASLPDNSYYNLSEKKDNYIVSSIIHTYFNENISIKFRLINRNEIEIKGKIINVDRDGFTIKEDGKDLYSTAYILVDPSTIMPLYMEIKPIIRFGRQNIAQGTRFDIFNRDNFICTYCGRSPPDVQLEIDHILPISQGGSNNIDNLTTSCMECNRGKSAKNVIGA